MQLTGDRFTSVSALVGNDLATLPEFPAEIRAPAGTLAGVSGFQVHISDHDITTPGDAPQRARGHEPGRARAEIERLVPGGTLIVNSDTFDERNLDQGRLPRRVRHPANPLTDGSLDGYTVFEVPMTQLTKDAVLPLGRQAARRRALEELLRPRAWCRGCTPARSSRRSTGSSGASAQRPGAATPTWPRFKAGHAFGETAELFDHPLRGPPGHAGARHLHEHHRQHRPGVGPGRRRRSWPKLPLFLGCYPITPASDILHELSKHKNFGVRTAAGRGRDRRHRRRPRRRLRRPPRRAPRRAVRASPLKGETMGLAVSLELPLLIIDIQRGGPSTGLPTKTEAADLLMAHVRPPRRVAAADRRRRSPSHCF